MLSIGKAAEFLGVCIMTLRRWNEDGVLIPDFITPGKHRRYKLSNLLSFAGQNIIQEERLTVGYARVSSHDQKKI